MGGSSSSATATSTQVDSSTTNSNQAGADAAVLGSFNRVTTTDHGAVDSSFNLGEKSIDLVRDAVTGVFSFAGESQARAYEFGTGSLDHAFALTQGIANTNAASNTQILQSAINAASQNGERAYTFATQVARPQDANSENLKIMAAAAVAIALAYMFAKRSK